MNSRLRKSFELCFFLFPACIPLILFWVYPILDTFRISFTDWDYMSPAYHIVWLENYLKMFRDPAFLQALKVTLLFGAETVIPSILLGLFAALLLHGAGACKNTLRALLFSPWITPVVAVSIVWTWILEPDGGIANHLLSLIGLPTGTWLHSSGSALGSVALVTVWKSTGYVMLFYIGALSRVPKGLYEAARVDGAGKLRTFFNITVPMISPTTLFLTILLTIQSLQAYGQIQILTQGGPSGSTRTLLYRYYQLAFEQFDMGGASATVIVLLALTFALSLAQFWMSGKSIYYGE